ncbi:MAG TPA: BTAD domain-containing putative transcriptional regulator [Candidatus Dormibacteraeota bacterium]|jgi:DNA-binding SARP family transcriptional activator|nr:BTAD domain-containing putative transcriptional regulator [Candidatus Dormibacteraeota bacterium]
MFGEPTLRIYLAGEVAIERGDQLLREADLPGPQGRLALVLLTAERQRPVPQSELAELLWPGALPASWPAALSAVISKLRNKLGRLGLDRDRVIANAFRCYQFRPPTDTWVDLEAAADAVHAAEGALLVGDARAAYGPALVAATIARRPFLIGEEASWVSGRREWLADILIRALDCRVEALLANGELALALDAARAAVAIEPYRESGYRHLMRVFMAHGDRGAAVDVYNECRRRLAEDLGISPAIETETLLRSLTV